jgi:hypothetical protein
MLLTARPKNQACFRKYRGGNRLEEIFLGNSLIIWKFKLQGTYKPHSTGNLPCFWSCLLSFEIQKQKVE